MLIKVSSFVLTFLLSFLISHGRKSVNPNNRRLFACLDWWIFGTIGWHLWMAVHITINIRKMLKVHIMKNMQKGENHTTIAFALLMKLTDLTLKTETPKNSFIYQLFKLINYCLQNLDYCYSCKLFNNLPSHRI